MPADELFLEIGTEEIPSRFLPRALEDLRRLAEKMFRDARISHGSIRTLGTPRRLALVASEVAEAQRSLEQRVTGPARRVAYDESGAPTKAGEGFARSQGVSVEALEIVETDKGEYVAALKKEEGRKTQEVLRESLPTLIQKLTFPKSMRWGCGELRFARPIHWIVALYGGGVIPFELGGIASGRKSRGHRFMAPEDFEVKDFTQYVKETREHFVIADPEGRIARIRQISEAAASEVGGKILRDDELLEEVAGLVEYPTALPGRIETEFLKLPREVLITSMKHHQRYFSVIDGKGALLPHFVAISNTRAADPEVVRRGNERVLRARLADAEYFHREDAKRPLETYVESLKNVIFQKDLGTSFEKVERIVALSGWLAEKLAPGQKTLTNRAAWLCKADLETQMVYEFPELQGIMGREYARLSGEDGEVCRAIDEHYRPRSAEDGYPSAGPAAFVGIADKLDTLVGYVGLGQLPSGSEDPFGLRRAARGVLGTIQEHGYRLNLLELIQQAVEPLAERLKIPQPGDLVSKVSEFLISRLENLFLADGFRADLIRAILEAKTGSRDIVDARKRLEAISSISQEKDFEPLTTTFKRVMNIIPDEKQEKIGFDHFKAVKEQQPRDRYRIDLLHEDSELALHTAYRDRAGKIEELLAKENYTDALREIAALRPVVDTFFDDVLVMSEDQALRGNRLGLLSSIGALFAQVADFRKIVSPQSGSRG
ncbi:MAG: glycine--tRNA ligase subunit beta [Nitrospinota bacterium]